MTNTKIVIVEGSIRLFNKRGYSNVSLQSIARDLQLSPGNLTYHFPKKENLMMAIYEHFVEELNKITSGFKSFVGLKGMDYQLRSFYDFQVRFRFFYVDIIEIERSNPELAERHYKHIEKQIEGIYKTLMYNVGQSRLSQYSSDEYYSHLARQIWMTIVFWSVQLLVRGKTSKVEELLQSVWMQIKPHMTDLGLLELKNLNNKLETTV